MPATAFAGLQPAFRQFLAALRRHNDREWFDAHRDAYESDVREPALELVRALAPRLRRLAPGLLVDDARSGGSLLRQSRDLRFARTANGPPAPYHEAVVLAFPHAFEEPSLAPGVRMRLGPKQIDVSVGVFRPLSRARRCIRDEIVAEPAEWGRILRARAFKRAFEGLPEPDLARVPRGYPADAEHVVDLRRNSWVATRTLPAEVGDGAAVVGEVVSTVRAGVPLLRFLCDAVGLAWDPWADCEDDEA